MTKIKGGTPGQGFRAALKGRYIKTQKANGLTVVSTWPKKRGLPTSSAQALAQQTFASQIAMLKYADGEDVAAAYEHSPGTAYMPRDILMAAMTGNLLITRLSNGTIIAPWRLMSSSIQAMLDSISTDQGTIIYRSNIGWVALDPGTAGNVLTTYGTGIDPAWAPVTAPSGAATPTLSVEPVGGTSIGTGADCYQSESFIADVNFNITAVWCKFTASGTGAYCGGCGETSATSGSATLTSWEQSTPVILAADVYPRWHRFALPTMAEITAGKNFLIALGLTNKTATTAAGLNFDTNYQRMPIPAQPNGLSAIANLTPGVGTSVVLSSASSFAYGVGIEWAFPS